MGVVLSALLHRLVFGYRIIGPIRGNPIFDASLFDRGETHETDGTGGKPEQRPNAEPWLPWFYKWHNVAIVGLAFGALGGLTFYWTGSVFLAFGFSAATLILLNLGFTQDFGVPQLPVPVTHHITLPASTAVAAHGGFRGGAGDRGRPGRGRPARTSC